MSVIVTVLLSISAQKILAQQCHALRKSALCDVHSMYVSYSVFMLRWKLISMFTFNSWSIYHYTHKLKNVWESAVINSRQTEPKFPDSKVALLFFIVQFFLYCAICSCHFKVGGHCQKLCKLKVGKPTQGLLVIDSLSATTKNFLQGFHHSDEIRHYVSNCGLFTRILNSEKAWNEDSSDQLCGVSWCEFRLLVFQPCFDDA